jgi:valyl-tRNA synthetase
LLRVFALYLPFVTEEVWSWWQPGSVHAASWPAARELFEPAGGESGDGVRALELAAAVLGEIRKKKSEEQRPLKTPVARARVQIPDADRALLATAERDLRASGLIQDFAISPGETFHVDVELAAPERTPQEHGA